MRPRPPSVNRLLQLPARTTFENRFMSRRQFGGMAAGLAATAVSAINPAQALAWPARHVRVVVPFAAGGAADPLARIVLGERASAVWRQRVVIENRGGAGGKVGIEMVARAEHDGYTMLVLGTGVFAIQRFVYDTDLLAGITPVAAMALVPNIMVVPKNSPAKTVSEFVEYAKTKQGGINYSSSGVGTSVHLAGELFKRMTNVEMTHIPYRGGGLAMGALLAGDVDVMFAVAPVAVPQIQSGTIRGLGVTSTRRITQLPDLMTLSEAGLGGFDVSARYACFTTSGAPAEIVKKMNADVVSVLKEPSVIARLEKIGYLVEGSTPEELSDHLKSEFGQWSKIIREMGIAPKQQ